MNYRRPWLRWPPVDTLHQVFVPPQKLSFHDVVKAYSHGAICSDNSSDLDVVITSFL